MAGDRPDPEPDDEDRERGERISNTRSRRSARGQTRESQTIQTEQSEQTAETKQGSQIPDSAETDLPSQTEQTEQTEQAAETKQGSQIPDSAETDLPSQTKQTQQTDEGKQAEQTTQAKQTGGGEAEAVTDRKHATFYLGSDLAGELDLRQDEVNLALRREYGADATLEKNRHWRPLLLALGMDALEDMDAEEVREFLDGHELLDDAPRE